MKLTSLIQDKTRSAAAMTVRAQAVAEENPDELRWDIFSSRKPVNGLRFSESALVDFRFVAERRPYNTRGIEMPEKFGSLREFMHLPIQARKTIDEEEIEALGVATDDERILIELLGGTVPGRVDAMTLADYRRYELDFFRGWATGTILAKNYATKAIAIVSFGFAADRYKTAATPWSDAGVNAYDEAVAFARSSKSLTGGIVGFYLSGDALEAIRADAPANANGRQPGDADLADLIGAEAGIGSFRFVTDDRVFNVPSDATADGFDITTGTAPQRVWPVGAVAAIPAGIEVADSCFSPVRRASDIAGVDGKAKVSNRDVTIVYVPNADDTQVEIQAQLNAYPAFIEQRTAVIDTGITKA